MSLRKKEAGMGILLVMPFLVGFLLFYIIPFVISIRYSFTSGIGGISFVGFNNYIEVFRSHAFQLAAANTFRFMGVGLPLLISISLGMSLLVFQNVYLIQEKMSILGNEMVCRMKYIDVIARDEKYAAIEIVEGGISNTDLIVDHTDRELMNGCRIHLIDE